MKPDKSSRAVMNVSVSCNPDELGWRAASSAANVILECIADRGQATLILATGASQFATLSYLSRWKAIPWSQVTLFHLDEYIGIPITHAASFRKYLWERFISHLPLPPRNIHFIQGDHHDPELECQRLSHLISALPMDLALIGIGENGHLAFNDPPANFNSERPYHIVDLDEKCRMQQVGEGWFPNFGAVPHQAISMSCQEILKAHHLIVSCPDTRKAQAVADTIEGPVSPWCPASILQLHPKTEVYLDTASAGLLKDQPCLA